MADGNGSQHAIHTIGYAGRDLAGFLAALEEAGVAGIVDIRERPYSRKRDFNKKALSAALAEHGLSYTSRPDLGIPSAERKGVDTDEQEAALLARYRERLDDRDDLGELARQVAEHPLALMCMESNPAHCHRSMLAAVLSEMTGQDVVHL